MPRTGRIIPQSSLGRIGRSPRLHASVLFALVLCTSPGAKLHADEPPARAQASPQYLPTGSQCRGLLPCDKSGDFGIHVRLLGAIALDEQHKVRNGLLVPTLI